MKMNSTTFNQTAPEGLLTGAEVLRLIDEGESRNAGSDYWFNLRERTDEPALLRRIQSNLSDAYHREEYLAGLS